MSEGIRGLAFGLAPLALAAGAGAKKFADFEQQMSVVRSITGDGKMSQNFADLTARAKQLGASTQFTATEAAQGMEFLARAGFDTADSMTAVGAALDLAAADSIELSQAADIVAQSVRAMGLDASEASNVADMLAQTSRNSNTNVIALGESMKFAATTSKSMNIPLDETLAIIGKISDAGLRGTIAGTSFSNMMVKLSKPSSRAKKIMKELNIDFSTFVDETTGATRVDFPASIETMSKALLGIKDPMKRAAASAELFGLRGQKAANAFIVAGAEGLTELNDKIKASAGVAKEMARVRLDNFTGQITLLTSALEGFMIEAFGPLMGPMKGILQKDIIPSIQGVVTVMQNLKGTITDADLGELRERFGDTIVDVALGIADGLKAIRDGFDFVMAKARELAATFGATMGEGGAQRIAKIVTLIALAGAALAPLVLGALTFGLVIGGAVQILMGLATVLTGAFLPVLIVLGALALTFTSMRSEGEGFGSTMQRVWRSIKQSVLDVWRNTVQPFWEGVKSAAEVVWPQLRDAVMTSMGLIKQVFLDVLGVFGVTMDSSKGDWQTWGETAVVIISTIIETVVKFSTVMAVVFGAVVKLVVGLATIVLDVLLTPFKILWDLLGGIFTAFKQIFSGDIVGGLKTLGKTIVNFLLSPIRFLLKTIVKLADSLNIGDQIPQALRDFANKGSFEFSKVASQGDLKGRGGVRGAPAFLGDMKDRGKVAKAVTDNKTQDAAATNAFGESIEGAISGLGESLGGKIDAGTAAAGKSPCIDNNVRVNIDGAEVARSQSQLNQELKDRAGFKATPWQRRVALEHGGAPTRR